MRTTRYVSKPWGDEIIWATSPFYAGKIITIKAGCKLSLQKHNVKHESIYVLSGTMQLHIKDGKEMRMHLLQSGDNWEIPPGTVHRFEAVTDTQLIEVSTPQLDDVVRLEDDYGRAVGSSRQS